jgi:hypothetical protein
MQQSIHHRIEVLTPPIDRSTPKYRPKILTVRNTPFAVLHPGPPRPRG